MLDLVSEDVNNALKGDATYSRSMTAFRLLAIALQDIEAILSTVVEAVQHRDPPETCKASQKWLDETRVLLREALEAIRKFAAQMTSEVSLPLLPHPSYIQLMNVDTLPKSRCSSDTLEASIPSLTSMVALS